MSREGTDATSRVGELTVEQRSGNLLAVCFTAMASPCEVLLPASAQALAVELGLVAAQEAWRIEAKFSRYLDNSVVADIHRSRGSVYHADAETALLLDFARQCFELSDGLFDITCGVLRRAWRFDGSDNVPDAAAVEGLLPLIGFDKLQWQAPNLVLPRDMELDFGGAGKEYAVDRAFELLAQRHSGPFLVNFGGDLRANKPLKSAPWVVGIERPDHEQQMALALKLERGAIATSGDARRYLLKDGVRYGHVLNPRTGWPVMDAPRSVSVAAATCTEAGLISTLALLHGAQARAFLEEQGTPFWLVD